MLDSSEPVWGLALLLLGAMLFVCVVAMVGLADPATERAGKLRMVRDDGEAVVAPETNEPPHVMSPWRPALAILLAVWLGGLSFWMGLRDIENRSRWTVMVMAAGGGAVWGIGLVKVALNMAERVREMYGG